MKQRIISGLLAAAMLIAALASCSSGGTDSPSAATAGNASAEAAETVSEAAETEVSDDLPQENFEGAVYTVLQRTGFEYEFGVEEETGDALNDAIYYRNRTVEERFNAVIETVALESAWGTNRFNTGLQNTIMSGDDAYTIIAGYAAMILGAVESGYFIDWYKVPNINLSKPWWSEQIADCFTINDIMYGMTGDIGLSVWKCMVTLFFNKKLAENYGIGDLYQTVRDGGWTFAKLLEACKGISQDIDGNGKYDENDLYGYISCSSTPIDSFMQAFDIQVLGKNKDGWLEYKINSEKTVKALEKIQEFFYSGDNSASMSLTAEQALASFKADRALFHAHDLRSAEELRDMESDFGLLPYPKFDETQEKYYSTSTDNFSLFLFPSTVSDIYFAGTVTEALAAESYKQVVPVYYTTVLKDKYSRDAESSEMLDIIRDNLVYDIGYINSYYLGLVGHVFVELARKGATDFASAYARGEAKYQTELEKMLEAYQK